MRRHRYAHRQSPGRETGARNSCLLLRLLQLHGLHPRCSHKASPQDLARFAAPMPLRWVWSAGGPSPRSSAAGPRGLTALQQKMAAYRANGAGLGWLLIPEQQAVEIWSSEASGEPLRLEAATTLEGDERFPGLRLELAEIWEV